MKTIILFLISCSNLAFSQKNTEKKNAKYYEEKIALIDSKQVVYKDSINFVINDSINSKVFRSNNLITVRSLLKKSNSNFDLKYYFQNGKLFFVKFIEESPKFKKTNKILRFTVVNNKPSFFNSEYEVGINLPPMQMNKKEVDRNFGYNPNLSNDFILSFIEVVSRKLKLN